LFDRVVLITNGNLPSMLALAGWLRAHGHSLVKVYVTYRLPSSKGNISGGLSMLRHSGWDYTWLKVWVNRIAPMRLRRAGLPASVSDYLGALGLSVPVEAVDSVKTPEVLAEVFDLAPELLVSFSATQRFSDELIGIPSVGAINVHYGALPRYAGLSPYYWHLHNEEPEFGVTLHRIESELDAGGIIEQSIRPVGDQKTCLGLMLDMAGQVSPLLNRFHAGETRLDNVTGQDLSQRSYFRHPDRAQVADFKRRGYRMMDADARKRVVDQVSECRPAS
jgi:methionyl-tRNA formyltransferase